jgi:hypothetical protein
MVPRFIDNIGNALASVKEDNIVIYFAELGLYGVFSPNIYRHFCENIHTPISSGDLPITDLYQVVLTGHKQKFVFACSNQEYIDGLRKHAELCFAKTTKISKMEITVDTECDTGFSIYTSYQKLYRYLEKINEHKYLNSMNPILESQMDEYLFRLYNCNDNIDTYLNNNNIMSILRNIPTTNGTINIVMGNQINTTVHNNATDTNTNKYQIAKKWVKDNPPNCKELSTAYYARYKDDVGMNLIDNSKFGPIVTASGYLKRNSGTGRYWIKG